MRRKLPIVWRAVLALLTVVSMGCTADVPNLEQDGSVAYPCTPYADLVVDYAVSGAPGDLAEAARALGEPNGESIVVQQSGVLTVGFAGLGGVLDAQGVSDILIHATGTEDAIATIYVAANQDDFTFAGEISGIGSDSFPIDLSNPASVSVALYVRIVVMAGSYSVDGVESTSTLCTDSFAP